MIFQILVHKSEHISKKKPSCLKALQKRTLPFMLGSYLVGISGGSASGKTSFIKALREHFSEEEVGLISQDNYYRAASCHAKDENGHINYDLPECIDMPNFLHDIQQLKLGKPVELLEYAFQNEMAEHNRISIMPAPIIIVEGLFIMHFNEIADELNLKIFIDADESIKLRRRVDRDIAERGISREQVLYQWEHHVKPSYRKFLEPYKNDSDIIINNNEHYLTSLGVITDHIKTILKNEL